MKTLTALVVTAAVFAGTCTVTAQADELATQLRTDVRSQLITLQQLNKLQAEEALHKTVIDVIARQTAEQDVDALLAFQPKAADVAE